MNRPLPRTLRTLAVVFCLLTTSAAATAQTDYTWTGNGGNGNWNNPGNWDSLPVSGTGTRIVLDGISQTVTNQNFPTTPFVINQLRMNGGAANGFTVNGLPLQVGGSAAAIQSSSTGGALVVNAPIDFAADTAINLSANYGGGDEMVLAGRLSSPAPVTLTVNGTTPAVGLAITGRNNTGLSGTLQLGTGTTAIVNLGAANALGRGVTVDLTGGATTSGVLTATTTATGPGFANAGYDVQLGGLAGTANGPAVTAGSFQVGNLGSPSTVLVGFSNADTALTANNTTSGASLFLGDPNSHFGKVGTGTFTYGGPGPLAGTAGAGSISVRDGTILLQSPSGGGGAFQNGNNPQGDITVYAGALLRLNNGAGSNVNENRIGNTATVVLDGGTLQLDGRAGQPISERFAGLRLGSGQSTVAVNAVDRGTRFTLVNTITANPTATLFFQGANFGEQPSTSTTVAANGFNFDTLANATSLLQGGVTSGSYSSGTTILGIIPFATTGATNPDTFVTFDSANDSVRRLADTNYAPAFGLAANNVDLTSGAVVSAGIPVTANSLRLRPGGSVVANDAVTLTAGALLNNGGGSITGTGPLNFGSGGSSTAYITTNNVINPMTISTPINATNLSKSGGGNLILGGNVTLSPAAGNGVVAVNAGTLTVGSTATITNASTYQVSRGATLVVASNPLVLGAGQTLTGAGHVNGNVTLNSGSTIAPSALGGPQANLASPGSMLISPNGGGNLAINGGSTYVWYVSSAITDGDNTVAPTVDNISNFKSQYTASLLTVGADIDLAGASAANKITIKITSLAPSNAAGPLSDLNKLTDTRSWVIAQAVEGGHILNFSPDKFNLDASNFGNLASADPNPFTISHVGDSLVLTFTPVPESGAVLAVAAGALGLVVVRRRARAWAAA